MNIKLFDSELKIMELLWENGELSAKEIAEKLAVTAQWSKTTTYTVIKKCIDKGAIQRTDPKFICHPLITREEAQEYETAELINRMYDGSTDKLIASLLGNKRLTSEEISQLKRLVEGLK